MVQIISDSASDILQAEAEASNIIILPMKVNFGGTEYLDGKTLGQKEFYEKLIETDVLPTTSQVAPAEYEEAYRKALEDGKEVLCITLSSKLSGCYQSAMIAREDVLEDLPDAKIFVIDSENACLGQKVLVELAIRLREEGLSCEEIAKKMGEMKKRGTLVALIDALECLI